MIDAASLSAHGHPVRLGPSSLAQGIKPLLPRDPNAPAGPRPSFDVTPIEQLRDRSGPDAVATSMTIIDPGDYATPSPLTEARKPADATTFAPVPRRIAVDIRA